MASPEVLPPIAEARRRSAEQLQRQPPASAPGGPHRFRSHNTDGLLSASVPSLDWQRRDIHTAEGTAGEMNPRRSKHRRRFSFSEVSHREGDELLSGIQRHAAALQSRIQLVSAYAEAQRLPVVAPLDDLSAMPYRSYGKQLPNGQQAAHSTMYGRSYAIGFAHPMPGGFASVASVYESQVAVTPTHSRQGSPLSRLATGSRSYTPSAMASRQSASPDAPQPRPHTSAEIYFHPTRSPSPEARSAPGGIGPHSTSMAAGDGQLSTSYSRQTMASGLPSSKGDTGSTVKGTISEMDAVLMRINHLITASDDRERQEAAVLVIQSVFRGWVARKRYNHARWAMRAWRRQELAACRQRLLEWVRCRQAQEEYIYMVRRVQARDLARLAFRAWVVDIEESQRRLREKDRRAAWLNEQLMQQRGRDMLKQWLRVATGSRSRKACSQRYARRCAEAKTRLIEMADEMGWTGNITEDMIKRELENEAVNTVVTSTRRRVLGGVLAIWVRFARLRRIAKGKHLESDRKYHKVIINKCFKLWQRVVYEKRAEWKSKGWDFSRRKLWAVARREGRRAVMRWSLRFWTNRVRLHGRLNVFMKFMMSKSLASTFRTYREQTALQRALKRNAVERWQLVSRDKIAYPFRSWLKFTAIEKTVQRQRMKVAGGMLYRYRRRLMLRSLHAFRVAVEAAKYSFDFSALTGGEDGSGLRFSPRPSVNRRTSDLAAEEAAVVEAADDRAWDDKLESILTDTPTRSVPVSPSKGYKTSPGPNSPVRRRRARRILGEDSIDYFPSAIPTPTAPPESPPPKQPERLSGSLPQPAARFPGTSDLYAQMRAAESVDKVVRSLEANLDVVFASPLSDMESEARRLRVFLERLDDAIAATREVGGETEEEAVVEGGARQSGPGTRRSSMQGVSESGVSLEVGVPSLSASRGPRQPKTPKGGAKSNKSGKSGRSVRSSLSRHQRAFFKGMKAPGSGAAEDATEAPAQAVAGGDTAD